MTQIKIISSNVGLADLEILVNAFLAIQKEGIENVQYWQQGANLFLCVITFIT